MLADLVVPELANAKLEQEFRTLCRAHHLKRLMVFGSTIHGTAAQAHIRSSQGMRLKEAYYERVSILRIPSH